MQYSTFPLVVSVVASLACVPLVRAKATSGCGLDLPGTQKPGDASHMVQFNTSAGTKREYLIHIPKNYNKNRPVPLIFSFHGRGKNSSEQEELSQFSNAAFNPDGIAVYPQGLDSQWQGDPDSVDVDDLGFTQDMITHFSARYCLNSSRIYAAGKSNGGGFTNLLACDAALSTQIAAFAPVSGAFYTHDRAAVCARGTFPQTVSLNSCSPGRSPLPILEFHGSADETIPYAGGARRCDCLPTVPHWVREWSKREGFGTSNRSTALFGGNVTKYEYGADFGRRGIVTHYLVQGLGHDWPSTERNDDNKHGTYFNATPIIMDFFNNYTLPM